MQYNTSKTIPLKLGKASLNCQETIFGRHRHHYEFNNKICSHLAAQALIFAGTSPDSQPVEIIKLPQSMYPWFVAV